MKYFVTALLMLGLIALTTKSYLHAGIPYTHDGENHLARFANYKLAVREGQWPPRWAPNLMNHYGYPVFNYNYPLANILSLPFSFLKTSYILTFKILAIGGIATGLAGFIWLRKEWQLSWTSLWLAMGIYGTAPYLTNAVLYRGNIGEILLYGLLPWVVWVIERCQRPLSRRDVVLNVAIIIAFLLSHNVGVLMMVPLLGIYALFRYRQNLVGLKRLSLIAIWALVASLWFWLPALAEKSLTVLDSAGLSLGYADHFVTWSQLLWAPLGFGFSYLGSIDSLSFGLGLAQLAVFIFSGLWLFKTLFSRVTSLQPLHRVASLALVLAAICLVLQLPISGWLWQTIPILRFVQLPWRWGLPAVFLLTFVTLLLTSVWPRWVKGLIVLLLAGQIIYLSRLSPVDYRYINNQDLEAFSQSTTTLNENLPPSFTYLHIADWQPTAIVLPESPVAIKYWKGSDRQYSLELTQDSTIIEPTIAFAGWQTQIVPENAAAFTATYIDNETTQGRLAYQLPAGGYEVRTRFTQWTWSRILGNSLSAVAFAGLVVWLLNRKYDSI